MGMGAFTAVATTQLSQLMEICYENVYHFWSQSASSKDSYLLAMFPDYGQYALPPFLFPLSLHSALPLTPRHPPA